MRVVTLLPAATEIVCDYPASILGLTRVTVSPIDPRSSGAVIDAEVRRLQSAGKPVIGVSAAAVRRLAPDLIVTQDLCEVCAVADGEVHRLAAVMDPAPRVLTLSGRTVAGIWSDIRTLARALDLEAEGDVLVGGLQNRLERLRTRSARPRPGVVCIEWLEPLYLAGHWVAELVEAAGGTALGAAPGSHSARREWSDVAALRPDLVVVMLCGFGVDRAVAELAAVPSAEAWSVLGSTPPWVMDGNAYTSRSGPRIVDGAELLVAAFQGHESLGMVRWRPLPYSSRGS